MIKTPPASGCGRKNDDEEIPRSIRRISLADTIKSEQQILKLLLVYSHVGDGVGRVLSFLRNIVKLQSAPVLAGVVCVVALAGCAAERGSSVTANASPSTRSVSTKLIPVPGRALLQAQPEPDCQFNVIGQGDTLLDTNDVALMKLDYERQCYRKAEMIVRTRLRLLQVSVGETIKAVNRSQ